MIKQKIIVVTILILLGNQTFSQKSNMKGKTIDYETNHTLIGVMIADSKNTQNGTLSDGYGNFEIKLEGKTGELKFNYVGFYPIKFLNIPIDNKHIDFGEIKLVSNHLMDTMTIGGPPTEISEEQEEQDRKLRLDVLKTYRIKILGKKLTPYFEGKSLVFDFNKNEIK